MSVTFADLGYKSRVFIRQAENVRLRIAAHNDLGPAKYLIVSDNVETRKARIEEALRLELFVNPVVASPMNQK